MSQNYAEFSSVPPPYEVHPLPDGMAQVVFYYGAEKLPPIDDEGGDHWSARYCALETRASAGLAARVEAHYDDWFAMAKAQCDAETARQAREDRDALLSGTDYLMSADYPISDSDRVEVAAYRQALRDLPNTEGWPENITWPDKPTIGSGIPSGTIVSKVDELEKQNEVLTECLLEISGEVYG